MSTDTPSVGYPVHAVATFAHVTNPHGARFIDWTAQCGASGTTTGALGRAGSARKAELCRLCFPTRHWNSCKIDQPQNLTPTEGDTTP